MSFKFIFNDKIEWTKSLILALTTELEIFETFLEFKVIVDNNFKYFSPFRQDDKVPSCNFYYNNDGKLKLHDYSKRINMDCFEYVGFLHNIDCNDREGFKIILQLIVNKLNLLEKKEGRVSNIIIPQKKIKVIEVNTRNFNIRDLEYFYKFNISTDIIKKFQIYCCKYIFINTKLVYTYSGFNPAYAYYFGMDEKTKLKKIQIYKPSVYQQIKSFIINFNGLFGLSQLSKRNSFIILTKSYKDVCSLYAYGIPAISLPSESRDLLEEEFNYLMERTNLIISLFDYDEAGLNCAKRHMEKFKIPFFFIRESEFKNKNKVIKDFSSLVYITNKNKEKIEKYKKKIKNIYKKWRMKQK